MIEFEDHEELAFSSDTERLLGPSIDVVRYPILAAALAGSDGHEFRRELIQLFGPQLRVRARRRSVLVMCRLQGSDYDEPVLVKDISASGVRFLVQSDVCLDLTRFASMQLHVRISSGPRSLSVALVRRCGGDQRHTDLACRFLAPAADQKQIVAEIRSRIFGDVPALVPPMG